MEIALNSNGTADFVETADALAEVLAASRRSFRVERVRWADAPDWSLRDGALQHRSGGFFSVVGAAFESDPPRERLLLVQPQAAVTGLLTTVRAGHRYYLLQARPEPGCLGEAQFGPTVQSTPANYLRLHGGADTPYVEWFLTHRPGALWREDTTQSDLGRRYLMKSKRQIVVECAPDVEVRPGFVWASVEAIGLGLSRSAFFNIDLRSILSCTGWSVRARDPLALSPPMPATRASLEAVPRASVKGEVCARLDREPSPARFVPVDSLDNWQRTEHGLGEVRERQGFAVEFYDVVAPGRERERWTQPLVNSHDEGHVLQLCREGGEGLELLLRVVREPGLARGAGLAPSHVRYPGEPAPAPPWLPPYRTLVATTESDEGGRFFRDASRYELALADGNGFDAAEHGMLWLTLAELKGFLRSSNVCTIQLRGVASLLAAAR
jgi:oxidase EvaA